ncbi:helix-turn-helix transcriptional regulator [Idiomarina sp. PL1-037]|uniref:helix-turn-helix transcriptional regulator n=1 Tax=Idiomarina TaxID=135575 RepID=UPI00294B08E9|nr:MULTISPECIES: helix-turn-helix transcriptional regulator [unclassified Idiomarina]MDV6328454.1 helix-turn-helix transcriptional regulator [Idiomarina sp. Sol25]WQC53586.1 helix-turn-helix transcriptional regulator [Idiomarina sp. PL1-037]
MTPRKEIGKRLQLERKAQRLSQSEAAAKIKSNRQTISAIERGVYLGSLATFERYLMLFGYSLAITKTKMPTFEELDDLFPLED